MLKMEAKKIKFEELQNRVTLQIDGVPFYLANAFRRSILDYVPSMAIDEVEFFANDSVLYDEIIANRLGLVVLTTDYTYNEPQKCKCGGVGCSACQVKLKLDVVGPKTVYAEDLISEDPNIKPVYPKTIITKLLDGQKLTLIATARLTPGNEHAKGSPALSYYRYVPEIKIPKNLDCNIKEIQKNCPKKVFDIKDGKLVVNKNKLLDCDLCGECVELSNGQIKAQGKENSFLFVIESWGGLSHKDIIKKASEKLLEKLEEVEKLIK